VHRTCWLSRGTKKGESRGRINPNSFWIDPAWTFRGHGAAHVMLVAAMQPDQRKQAARNSRRPNLSLLNNLPMPHLPILEYIGGEYLNPRVLFLPRIFLEASFVTGVL
jgi:hypothetical protein